VQNLIRNIRSRINLSSEAEKLIYAKAKIKQHSKGDIIIQQGEPYVNKVFYVSSGCLRSYCIDKNDKEHTLQFAINDWWISDFIALYNNEPATLSVECITDSKIIQLNINTLNELFEKHPEFETFQRKNLERHMVSLHKRILNQLQLTAKERYELFIKQYPEVEQHVPNYHIASYLGITQQSLSRIRAEKAK
jgi:CRP-like cAMP-binding protein